MNSNPNTYPTTNSVNTAGSVHQWNDGRVEAVEQTAQRSKIKTIAETMAIRVSNALGGMSLGFIA